MFVREILQEMWTPEFSYEAAIRHAQDVAAKRGRAFIVRGKHKGDLDAFHVYAEDEYRDWDGKDKYNTIATVEADGYVEFHGHFEIKR